MQPLAKAKRIRMYVSENHRVGHRPAHLAVLELLRRERASGATVLHGIEGFGGSRVVHTANLGDVVERLPVIIEWIDTPEAVERLWPRLREMLPGSLITCDDTEVLAGTGDRPAARPSG